MEFKETLNSNTDVIKHFLVERTLSVRMQNPVQKIKIKKNLSV